tara:strand:+ start:1015 stop:1791 length:777 start_codon:yes stop_codon:yes gene_type:complete
MLRQFVKYHGAGNDFIVFSGDYTGFNASAIKYLCNRKLGIGADGLICVENIKNSTFDFTVHFFNSNGKLGSLCGNGSRCAINFAHSKGFFLGDSCNFQASDGLHQGLIMEDGLVSINFLNSRKAIKSGLGYLIDTGSPHYVQIVENLNDLDITDLGPVISKRVDALNGCNVNFIEAMENGDFQIITYERGVERETLSCGTGAVAGALVLNQFKGMKSPVKLSAKGGVLSIEFSVSEMGFENIILTGPVVKVFDGKCIV